MDIFIAQNCFVKVKIVHYCKTYLIFFPYGFYNIETSLF